MPALSLSTVTVPNHGLSPAAVRGVQRYGRETPWLVFVDREVDWRQHTIGHSRWRALAHVTTPWVMCLDSDDELISPLPDPTRVEKAFGGEIDGIVMDFENEGRYCGRLESNGCDLHATSRAIFRTEWLRGVLRDFCDSGLIREDVYMMWRLLEGGRFAYLPQAVLRRTGGRCNTHVMFRHGNRREYADVWRRVDAGQLARYNEMLLARRVRL
jgi:hypothetical protein